MEASIRDLREKAMARMPNIAREPTDFLVAVASHSKSPEACLPTDFMWFKCRARHSIAKIRSFYTQKSKCEVDLYIGSYKPADITRISLLDERHDHLVVFRAVETGTPAKANATNEQIRSPLRPTNVTRSPGFGFHSEETIKPSAKSNLSDIAPKQISFWESSSSTPGSRISGSETIPNAATPALEGERKKGIGENTGEAPVLSVPHEPCHPRRNKVPIKEAYARFIQEQVIKSERMAPSMNKPASPNHSVSLGSAQPPVAAATPLLLPNAAQNKRLLRVLAEASPEKLEAEVQESITVLDRVKTHLSNLPVTSVDAQQWLQQIEILRQRNQSEPAIIGVVGNTGAGKSSVINAMLDEERLVPTNCMRACTAVVTEISWNTNDDENAKYRAEIEFIQPEDWERELRILFAELLDANGKISRDAYNQDSEAGVAYAKIKAVYPLKTNDDIAQSSVAELMQEPVIRNILGTTKTVVQATSDRFYRILQSYVDSKEKSTGDKKQRKEMEYWPLIKVVKIYTKSDALSTGAVVVDLPGVHDSNAARSAIAQNYMKMCTGLWIVAPITRAVDDKAAKSLLGESFKRQLKYDGTYSRVTFICSKTDDISITEATDSLGLNEQISCKWDDCDQIQRDQKRLRQQMAELRESKAVYGEVLSDTDDLLELWDKLKDDLEDGKTVYAPLESSKKRKRSGDSTNQRKKRTQARSSDDEENDSINDDSTDIDDTQSAPSPQREPLTADMIDAKMLEFKETKKEARVQRRNLDEQILALKEELKTLDSDYDVIEAEMSAICIAGRNNYSKGAIQQDFAAGIKELDQENQIEMNEADFNPDEDLRDYAEVARSLPVFCVSSRAYQKLCGRLQRDKGVPGFGTIEETEIPQLQTHCKKLTEAGRIATCRRFLNAFSQLMNSMSLWASNDGSGISLTDAQVASEANFLQTKLSQLEKGLEKVVQDCLAEMKEALAENIYDKFEKIVTAAVEEANDIVAKWGAPVNRANRQAGGLYFGTYKAICRRDGVFNNGQLHDFNLQLTDPIIKQLGNDWEKAFARRLPHVLQSFTRSSKRLLQSFHEGIQSRVITSGTSIAGLAMLGSQLVNYERIFQDLTSQMIQVITERQRDANREFTPVIARHLLSAYQYCTAESGTGSYMRMKTYMQSHVDEHRKTMFTESTDEVKKHLAQMCRQIEEHMLNKADEVFVLMRRDYLTVITGAHVPEGHQIPKWERQMKLEITQILGDREEAAKQEDEEEVGDNEHQKRSAGIEDRKDQVIKPEADIDDLPGQFSSLDPIRANANLEYHSPYPREGIADQIQGLLNEKFKEEED